MCFVLTLAPIPEEPTRVVRFSDFDVVAKATRTGIEVCDSIPAGKCPFTSREMELKVWKKIEKIQKEVACVSGRLLEFWLQENPEAKKKLLSFLSTESGMLLFPEKMAKAFFDGHTQGIKGFIRSAVNENRDLYLPGFKGVDCERSLLTEFFKALVLYAKRKSPYEAAVVRLQAHVRGWFVRLLLEQDKWDQAFDWSQGL